MKCRTPLALVLLTLSALIALGCNGSSHSPSDPGSAPLINKLQNSGTLIRTGPQEGAVGISFEFGDPDADIDKVLVTFPEGVAENDLPDAAGKRSGTANFLQSVHVTTTGDLRFTVQVQDRLGHRSNTLEGTVNIP